MSDIPCASVVENVAFEPVEVQFECLLASLKQLEICDLIKIMKATVAEMEKRTKGTISRGKTVVSLKKAGSMPKGVVPPQLRKPRAWVDFTLQNALENGWDTFTVFQTRKDKITGEKVDEEIDMPCSELYEGAYVYKGSVTEKCPTGKQLIHKDAMSLSKQRWTPKEKTGTHPELYEEFELTYVEDVVEDDVSVTSSTKKTVIRKTVAEKTAEAEAKKAEKEVEKTAKKAEKEVEKAAKKAEKDAEKEAKKAEKEAEKAAKKAEKEAAKKPSIRMAIPIAAVKAVASVASVAPVVPVKAVVPVAAIKTVASDASVKAVAGMKARVKAVKDEWIAPVDGMVKRWEFKGKTYLRNSENELWSQAADGGLGEWQGVYIIEEDRIDDSVEEPQYDD